MPFIISWVSAHVGRQSKKSGPAPQRGGDATLIGDWDCLHASPQKKLMRKCSAMAWGVGGGLGPAGIWEKGSGEVSQKRCAAVQHIWERASCRLRLAIWCTAICCWACTLSLLQVGGLFRDSLNSICISFGVQCWPHLGSAQAHDLALAGQLWACAPRKFACIRALLQGPMGRPAGRCLCSAAYRLHVER